MVARRLLTLLVLGFCLFSAKPAEARFFGFFGRVLAAPFIAAARIVTFPFRVAAAIHHRPAFVVRGPCGFNDFGGGCGGVPFHQPAPYYPPAHHGGYGPSGPVGPGPGSGFEDDFEDEFPEDVGLGNGLGNRRGGFDEFDDDDGLDVGEFRGRRPPDFDGDGRPPRDGGDGSALRVRGPRTRAHAAPQLKNGEQTKGRPRVVSRGPKLLKSTKSKPDFQFAVRKGNDVHGRRLYGICSTNLFRVQNGKCWAYTSAHCTEHILKNGTLGKAGDYSYRKATVKMRLAHFGRKDVTVYSNAKWVDAAPKSKRDGDGSVMSWDCDGANGAQVLSLATEPLQDGDEVYYCKSVREPAMYKTTISLTAATTGKPMRIGSARLVDPQPDTEVGDSGGCVLNKKFQLVATVSRGESLEDVKDVTDSVIDRGIGFVHSILDTVTGIPSLVAGSTRDLRRSTSSLPEIGSAKKM